MPSTTKPANPVIVGEVVAVKRSAYESGLWKEVALAYVVEASRNGTAKRIRLAGGIDETPIDLDDVLTIGGAYQECAKRLADSMKAIRVYASPELLRDAVIWARG